MKVQLKGGGSVAVSDEAFAGEYNEALVHQVVTAYLAGGRRGTKAQKDRAQVRGGGAKPWRQKGTGRARAGSIRSPIWRGGGRAFAARPRNFDQKINRKMYRGAMRGLLAELLRQDRLVVVKALALEQTKTRELAARLAELELTDVLIVLDELDERVFLAARNLPHVEVTLADAVDPVSLLRNEHVLVTVDALKKLEERVT